MTAALGSAKSALARREAQANSSLNLERDVPNKQALLGKAQENLSQAQRTFQEARGGQGNVASQKETVERNQVHLTIAIAAAQKADDVLALNAATTFSLVEQAKDTEKIHAMETSSE